VSPCGAFVDLKTLELSCSGSLSLVLRNVAAVYGEEIHEAYGEGWLGCVSILGLAGDSLLWNGACNVNRFGANTTLNYLCTWTFTRFY